MADPTPISDADLERAAEAVFWEHERVSGSRRERLTAAFVAGLSVLGLVLASDPTRND